MKEKGGWDESLNMASLMALIGFAGKAGYKLRQNMALIGLTQSGCAGSRRLLVWTINALCSRLCGHAPW